MPLSRRPRLLGVALAGVAVLVVGPSVTTQAAADEPAAGTVVGELVRAFLDPSERPDAREFEHAEHAEPLIWVEPETGAAVRLTGERAEDLPVGATVQVSLGAEVVDEAAAEDGLDPARVVLAAEVLEAAPEAPVAPAALPYTNEVTVALVAPAGTSPDAVTPQQIADVVAGDVAAFWERESYGDIRIGVAPLTVESDWESTTTPCSEPETLWWETATRLDFDVDEPGKHLLLYLPAAPEELEGCGYGLGSLGSGPGSGGVSYVRDVKPSVMAHELGHNFGLEHSSMLRCPGSMETGDCWVFPYDDRYDVMGYSWDRLGSLSALNGSRIGILPSENVHTVNLFSATDDYVLEPIGNRAGRVGIKLTWDDLVYWLEYRPAVGTDDWLAGITSPALLPGVLLRTEVVDPYEDIDDGSLLLDGSPGTAWNRPSDQQTVLAEGQSFWLAGGAFHVTVKDTGTTAVVRVSALPGAAMPRDLDENLWADVFAVDGGGVLWNYHSTSTGVVSGRTRVGGGWQTRDVVVSAGDLDGDDNQDVLAREPRTGNLWFYAGNGYGALRAGQVISGGWNSMNALLSPGDFSGDGIPDLLARTRADGVLWMYPGDGAGGLGPRVRLGGGWGSINGLAATGDLDLNGTVDFLARKQDGVLVLYSGTGRGQLAPGLPRRIGGGWNVMTALTGAGDWDGDGIPDLLARKSDGSLMLYRGTGTTAFEYPQRLGGGWGSYRIGV